MFFNILSGPRGQNNPAGPSLETSDLNKENLQPEKFNFFKPNNSNLQPNKKKVQSNN